MHVYQHYQFFVCIPYVAKSSILLCIHMTLPLGLIMHQALQVQSNVIIPPMSVASIGDLTALLQHSCSPLYRIYVWITTVIDSCYSEDLLMLSVLLKSFVSVALP